MRNSCFLSRARPFKVAVSVALALSGVSAFGNTTSTPLSQTPSSGVGLKASSQSRQGNNALNGMVPLFSMNQESGNAGANASGLSLGGSGVGLRAVFAGQLGDGKTLVLFQNREGQFFASVVPLFNQAQLQSQMNGASGQAPALTGNGASERVATSGQNGTQASGEGSSAGGSQETSSAEGEERGASATQQTGEQDQSQQAQTSTDKEEDVSSTASGGSSGQRARGSGGDSNRVSGTSSGTSGSASASRQETGRPAASSYMGVTDAPADDTASGSSSGGESSTVAQNGSADAGLPDSSGEERSSSASSSQSSDSTSSGSHDSGSLSSGDASGGDTSGGDTSGGDTSGGDTSGGDTSGGDTSSSAGYSDASSSRGGNSSPLYTPTTSPSFGSSGTDASEEGQSGDASSGSSDGTDGQGGSTSDSSNTGGDDNGSSSGDAGSQGSGSADGALPAGTTSDVLDKVESAMNESSGKFDQVLGEYHDNYDKYTNPDAAGDSVCATPDAMIKHQTESQGYLANVNPSWTWSHAGHANSALGGWDHWPADERGHLTEFKDVPGKWNRLMPWFVISRVSGSHVAADIEVRNMAVYWFPKKDKQWHLLAANLQPDAAICTPDDVNMSRCKSTFSGKASTGTQNAIHGWFTHVEVPDGAQAISVAVEARLVKGGPALMTVAGDYYPPDTVSLGGKFVPGAAASAPQRLKDNGEWTVVTMTTLTDQTKDDTGISRDMLMKRSPQCKNPARHYRP